PLYLHDALPISTRWLASGSLLDSQNCHGAKEKRNDGSDSGARGTNEKGSRRGGKGKRAKFRQAGGRPPSSWRDRRVCFLLRPRKESGNSGRLCGSEQTRSIRAC